jgi:hypothetical protein
MIFPTSSEGGPWLLGPRRRRLSLLDQRFRANLLGEAPHTEVTMAAGRPMVKLRWLNGFGFNEAGVIVDDETPNTFDPVRPSLRQIGATANKPADPVGAEYHVYPFELVAGTKTSTPGYGEDAELGRERNRAVLDNWLSWGFARALISHPTSTITTPDGTKDVLSFANIPMRNVSTNVPLIEAFVGVDAELTELLGEEAGMIHMSATAYAWIQTFGGFQFDEELGIPVSPNGHFVIVEPGYEGLKGPGGTAGAAGKDWIIGTAVIQWIHTGLYSPGGLNPLAFENATDDAVLFNPSTNKTVGFDELWGLYILRPFAVSALGVYPTGA